MKLGMGERVWLERGIKEMQVHLLVSKEPRVQKCLNDALAQLAAIAAEDELLRLREQRVVVDERIAELENA